MITCNKCSGKVFVDLTFTDNKNYELFCLSCGKRTFVGSNHEVYPLVSQYVKAALSG